MATRSYIGREYGDGSVRAVYCHWDGYPDNNGRILVENWRDGDKVECMLDEGDMSTLGNEIGVKHDFNTRQAGSCTFYRRDREETGVEAKVYPDFEGFLGGASSFGCDFAYLWQDGDWRCWSVGGEAVEQDIGTREFLGD